MDKTDDTPAVSLSAASSPPPDHDLKCPLCGYSLRGLNTPRCPECGFGFEWKELLDAERQRHNYLFEQGRGRNFSTFFRTLCFSHLPWKFWTDLTPAMPVKKGRLKLYWVLCGLILIAIAGTLPVAKTAEIAIDNYQYRADFKPVPDRPGYARWGTDMQSEARLRNHYPLPWESEFLPGIGRQFEWNYTRELGLRMTDFYWTGPAVVLVWPWLTLAALLIFRVSMRQAKIKSEHMLRVILYSSDYVLPVLLVGLAVQLTDPEPKAGVQTVVVMVACAMFTTLKAGFGFERYLRVHLPLATVLASQAVVLTFLSTAMMLWLVIEPQWVQSFF